MEIKILHEKIEQLEEEIKKLHRKYLKISHDTA